MKKNLVFAATAMCVLVAASGCGSDAGSEASVEPFGDCEITGTADSITLETAKPNTLTVATALPNPGWWTGKDAKSITSGFEYCMAAEIAHMAGVDKLNVMNLSWDQYISGSATGYDIAIATTTITEEREEIFNFSRPYFSANLSVSLTSDSDVTEETLTDARIAVLQGSSGAMWVNDVLKPATKPTLFSDANEMFTALASGQVDAVVTDTPTALTQNKPTGGRTEVVAQFDTEQGYGVITPLDSPNTEAVDTAVGTLVDDGTIARLTTDYLKPLFGVDPNTIQFWDVQ